MRAMISCNRLPEIIGAIGIFRAVVLLGVVAIARQVFIAK